MNYLNFSLMRAQALLLATSLVCGVALAEKPEWAGGGGKGQKQERKNEQEAQGGKEARGGQGGEGGQGQAKQKVQKAQVAKAEVRVGGYFVDQQRVAVREYYAGQVKAGRCPPGLAKKNNGCMPPGQAKKWVVGQPLPSNVVFYPVPQAVTVRLGVPPSGHRYVRVAGDILLIAVGTSLVIDAIQDLGLL